MSIKSVKKYYMLIICGILFVFMGSALALRGNSQSKKIITDQQDEILFQLASTIDNNLTSILSGIQNQVYYTSSSSAFKSAETQFMEKGQKSELWNLLRYNSLCESELIDGIICYKNGSLVLSTKEGRYDNIQFYDSMGNYRMKLCRRMNDKYYMAFQFGGNYSELKYYALIDLNALYNQVADTSEEYVRQIVLYNYKLSIVIAPVKGKIRAIRMPEYWKEGYDVIGEYISDCAKSTEESVQSLQYEDTDGKEKKVYLATRPAENCKNKNFSITVLTDYKSMYAPLSSININLIGNMTVIALGLCMLIGGYVKIGSEHRRANVEIQELKEKNEAARELLERTKKLEHIQRLELLGTMTSGISHEFNNLLTPIMGYSIMSLEMLPEGNDELSENIIEIYNASKKAKDIVKRISELSKKNNSDSLTPVNIDELILKVESMIKPATPDNIRIAVQLRAGTVRVRANETQMTQVLMNIMLNGVHAMEENGGVLSVSTSENGGKLKISIRDSGSGISPEVMPHIFDPFFTTKEAGKGTGLGLAIVKNILDELGADLKVDSEPGKGTEFDISLSIIPEAEVSAASDSGINDVGGSKVFAPN